jgi:hypothetical protein
MNFAFGVDWHAYIIQPSNGKFFVFAWRTLQEVTQDMSTGALIAATASIESARAILAAGCTHSTRVSIPTGCELWIR